MQTVSLVGHAGRSIDAYREERGNRHLLLLLPGYAFSPWMALYQLAGALAARRHADLLVGGFGYDRIPGFMELPEDEHWETIGDDAEALWRLVEMERFGVISVIGKSLGTRQVAALVERALLPRDTRVVALTPTLRSPRLRAASHPGPTLWIAGDADAHFDPAAWEEVTSRPRAHQLLVEGVGHGMERDDPYLTLDAWRRTIAAIDAFLFSPPASP